MGRLLCNEEIQSSDIEGFTKNDKVVVIQRKGTDNNLVLFSTYPPVEKRKVLDDNLIPYLESLGIKVFDIEDLD